MEQSATQIGVVTISHGTATAEGIDGVRDLAADSPVFSDDLVKTTGPGSAVEIKFSDGAVLSQGPNSSIVLDTYVYDPDQSTGEMAIKMVEGTFRSVTGEIVDLNPEGFSLETPLATIGIRGTVTGHTVGSNGQESHVVVDFVDKPVVIRPTDGGPVRVVARDGMGVTASREGLSQVARASKAQLDALKQLSGDSLRKAAPSFNVKDAEDDAKESEKQAEEAEQQAQEAAEEAAKAEAEAAEAKAAAEAAAAKAAAEAEAEAQAQAAAEAARLQAEADRLAAEAAAEKAAAEEAEKLAQQALIEAEANKAYYEALQDTLDNEGVLGPDGLPEDDKKPEDDKPQDYDLTPIKPLINTSTGDPDKDPNKQDLTNQGSTNGGEGGGEGGGNNKPGPVINVPKPPTQPEVERPSEEELVESTPTEFDLSGVASPDIPEGTETIYAPPNDKTNYILNNIPSSVTTISLGDGNNTIVATSGAKVITLGDGNNTVTTGSGNDKLTLGSGNNIVNAGDGNNTITVTGDGNNSITTGAGNDNLTLGSGNNTIDAGDGNNIIAASGDGNNNITTGDGADSITIDGGGNNTINLGGGDDTVTLGDGNNVVNTGSSSSTRSNEDFKQSSSSSDGNKIITTGNGNNTITTGNGDDDITTGTGNDTINGGAGADTIDSGAGDDYIFGGLGDDSIESGAGADTVYGDDGSDIIYSGAGNDSVHGGLGSDALVGGAGADTLMGEEGDDLFIFQTNDVEAGEEIHGGDGDDTIHAYSYTDFSDAEVLSSIEHLEINSGSTAEFSSSQVSFLADLSTVSGSTASGTTEYLDVNGTSGDDTIDLSDLTFSMTNWDSNDQFTVNAGAGNDVVTMGGAVTTLIGGEGDDTLSFFNSIDISSLSITGFENIDLLSASTTVSFDGEDITGESYALLGSGLLSVTNTTPISSIDLSGLDYTNFYGLTEIALSDNGDYLNLGDNISSAMTVIGGDGDDTLKLESASTLGNVTGVEEIQFGTGSVNVTSQDSLVADGETLTVTASPSTGIGFDGSAETNGHFTMFGGDGNDSIIGGAMGDTLNGAGGNDLLSGSGGNDELFGLDGSDSLYGDAGDDSLYGGAGEDSLIGGDDNDQLSGGAGADTMLGGLGNDVFTYGSSDDATGDVIDGGDGVDEIKVNVSTDFTDLTGVTGVEELTIGPGVTATFGTSSFGAISAIPQISGGGSSTVETLAINGTSGGDTISFSGVSLSFVDWDSNDVFSFSGGDGNDSVVFGDIGLTSIDGGDGIDTLSSEIDLDFSAENITNFEVFDAATASTILNFDAADLNEATYTFTGMGGVLVGNTTPLASYDFSDLTVSGLEGSFHVQMSDEGDSLTLGSNMVADTYVEGGAGDDTLNVEGGADLTHASSIEHLVYSSGVVDVTSTSDMLVDTGATLVVDGTATSDMTFWAYQDYNSHFHLIGGAGDDYLKGSSLSDTLDGGAGDDCLRGWGGDDTIYGSGGGNDTIEGNDGHDLIDMGTAMNTSDHIDGGDGVDTLLYTDSDYQFNDMNNVTNIEVVQFGDANTDVTLAGDILSSGTVTIDGGALTSDNFMIFNAASSSGNAFDITGGAGGDTLIGGSLDDTIKGGEANDSVLGGGGADSIYGESGNDTLNGESDADFLSGGIGDDSIMGGSDNDTLDGGSGADTLYGDAGDDVFQFNSGEVASGEVIYGGSMIADNGTDVIYVQTSTNFSAATTISGIETISLASGQTATFGVAQTSLFNDFQWLNSLDTSDASAESVVVSGTSGDDVFDLTSSSVALGPQWGVNDSFLLDGGEGHDSFLLNSVVTHVNGGSGDDTISLFDGLYTNLTLMGIETIEVNDTRGQMSATDLDGQSYEMTGGGSLKVNFTTSETAIDFSSLNFVGGTSLTVLMSDTATHLAMGTNIQSAAIEGGAGDDTVSFTDDGSDVEDLAGIYGVENIVLGDADTNISLLEDILDSGTLFVDGSALTGSNNLFFNGSAVTGHGFDMTGSDQGDTLKGGDNNDTLTGGKGDDSLVGNKGEDTLYGGEGDDTLVVDGDDSAYLDGGIGDDSLDAGSSGGYFGDVTLNGGAGADTLLGGYETNNTFLFNTGDVATGEVIDGADSGATDTIQVQTSTDFQGASTLQGIEAIKIDASQTATFDAGQYSDLWTVSGSEVSSSTDESIVFNIAGTSGDTLSLTDLSLSYWDSNDLVVVNGSEGGDTITGSSALDSIIGGAGLDSLTGNGANDTLMGGIGNDTLVSSSGGSNKLYGEDGDDVLTSTGSDSLYGGAGADSLFVSANTVLADGGDDSDSLVVNNNMDISSLSIVDVEEINLTNSDSVVQMAASQLDGSTYSIVGDGNLSIGSPSGDDTIDLSGLTMDDHYGFTTIAMSDTGAQSVTLDMGSNLNGSISVLGGSGTDELVFVGDGSTNVLDNVSGVESVVVTGDVNLVFDDSFLGASESVTIDVSGAEIASPLLNMSAETGTSSSYTVIGSSFQDTVIGGAGSDELYGGVNHDSLDGGSGDDSLYGQDGNDTLIVDGNSLQLLDGGAGDDSLDGGSSGSGGSVTLNGGSGADTMEGGYESNNTFVFNTGDVVTGEEIHGMDSGGTDKIYVETSTDFTSASSFHSIEQLALGAGATGLLSLNQYNDGFSVYGNSTTGTNETLEISLSDAGEGVTLSGAFNDFNADEDRVVVNGGSGSDTIQGLSSVDELFNGGGGGDNLGTNGGNDSLYGGAGFDSLFVTNTSDMDVLDGGADTDTLFLYTGSSIDLTGTTLNDIEVLHIQSGSITMSSGQACSQRYTVINTNGTDTLGNLIIAGSTGSTTINLDGFDLTGHEGTFTVNADAGDDLVMLNNVGMNTSLAIDGGAGDDTLNYSDPNGASNDFPGDFDNLFDVENIVLNGIGAYVSFGSDLFTVESTLTIDASALTDFAYLDGTAATDALLHITGSDYDDTLKGGDLDDSLYGGGGADSLMGDYGNDYLEGGAGNDLLTGVGANVNDGNDTMKGGSGNDTIYGKYGDDVLYGEDGDDIIQGEGGAGGISGNDTIYGGAGDDTISGDGGTGATGDDLIEGGGGLDVIDGGGGIDTVSFAGDADGIQIDLGETGNLIVGSTAIDGWDNAENYTNVEGVIGSAFADDIWGDANDNHLQGGAGNDYLDGKDGSDTLEGGAGDDTIIGGDGADLIYGDLGADDLSGDNGNDTIYGTTQADAQTDSGNNLDGGAGHDLLFGANGVDTFVGGSGNDTIFGGTSNDTMTTGTGADQIQYTDSSEFSGTGDQIIDFTSGTDYVWVEGAMAADMTWYEIPSYTGDAGDGITPSVGFVWDSSNSLLVYDTNLNAVGGESGMISSGIDLSFGDVFVSGHTITNADGDDITAGASASESLSADGSNTVLFGYDGNDTLTGGSGNDTLIGGTGTDSFDGGGGTNAVSFAYDGTAAWDSTTGVIVDLSGSSFGGLDADVEVKDGEGNFEQVSNVSNVIGSSYDDVIAGDVNDNDLIGGDGNDLLFGGTSGADTLTGSAGNDTFLLFEPTPGTALTIMDFDSALDSFFLDGTNFSDFFPGQTVDSSLFTTEVGTTYDGQNELPGPGLIYVSDTGSSTGELWFDTINEAVGGETLIATITEYSGGVESDNNIDETDFGFYIEGGGGDSSP